MRGETAIFGHYTMAGSSGVRVGVEGVADATGVTGTESASEFTVGGDVTLGDLTREGVDAGEEAHFFLVMPSRARSTSRGTAKTTVLL